MVFEALYPQMDFSDELIQKIKGIFETNAIDIRFAQTEVNVHVYSTHIQVALQKRTFQTLIPVLYSQVMALYEMASMLEHSCVSNVKINFDKQFNVRKKSLLLQWIPLNRDRFLQLKKSQLTENPLYPKLFMYCYVVNGFPI